MGWPEAGTRRLLVLVAVLGLLVSASCQQVRERAEDVREGVEQELGADGKPQGDGPEPDDDGSLGANAVVYLSEDVPRLVVEVDAVEGRAPGEGSLAHLRSVLSGVLHKPGGIEVMETETIGQARDRYSTGDLRALESQRRDSSSDGETASLYVLVVNGEFADGPDALGVAYSASSVALFRDKIEDAAGVLGSAERVERSVLVHEAGHLLRLVNIGHRSPREREDPEHEHHSTNRGSVMFWAVESDLITQVLDGPPPDDFDDADRADLEDIRTGQL